MPKYELKRKPSQSFKDEYIYFFLVNGIYHLAATYKTDEQAKKWYDKCREVFVEPIHTKLHTRMLKDTEFYLTQRQEIYVDPYNLEYYNKCSYYIMYGTTCIKNFIAYSKKENELKLAEATEYFNTFKHVDYSETMAEHETIICEDTN
jgi:hypothetical protein